MKPALPRYTGPGPRPHGPEHDVGQANPIPLNLSAFVVPRIKSNGLLLFDLPLKENALLRGFSIFYTIASNTRPLDLCFLFSCFLSLLFPTFLFFSFHHVFKYLITER